MSRIHILGASGTGTTTLGRAICDMLPYEHIDTDDYYWLPSDPPYQNKRSREERIKLLKAKLENSDNWVLSGSLCEWGDELTIYFDVIVYLWIPKELRLERLRQRELKYHGDAIMPGGTMHQAYLDFMEWAAKYDEGDLSIRSKALHEQWLSKRDCPVFRLEGDLDLSQRMMQVRAIINAREQII